MNLFGVLVKKNRNGQPALAHKASVARPFKRRPIRPRGRTKSTPAGQASSSAASPQSHSKGLAPYRGAASS